jgi:hypothetical protein
MLYSDIIAVHSQIHTKHINTVCGENVELLNVTLNGTCSDHWASGGKRCRSHPRAPAYQCRDGARASPPCNIMVLCLLNLRD